MGVALHHEDGSITYVADPYLIGMKWEKVRVNSQEFKLLVAHEKLFQLSHEYLRAAIVLCERAGEAGAELSWPQASVIYYTLHLATELFLKACLFKAGAPPKSSNHEIADLLKEYLKCFPENDFFFSTPWQISAGDINDALGIDAIRGVDRVPDQLYRYGMNKGGETTKGVQHFAPGYMYNYMIDIETRWTQIWKRLTTR